MLQQKFDHFKTYPTPSNTLQHVALVWPNACNMLRTTMLQDVTLKFCVRLAGGLCKTRMQTADGGWWMADGGRQKIKKK